MCIRDSLRPCSAAGSGPCPRVSPRVPSYPGHASPSGTRAAAPAVPRGARRGCRPVASGSGPGTAESRASVLNIP
eukprot:2586712-Rhodomonas_salina.2